MRVLAAAAVLVVLAPLAACSDDAGDGAPGAAERGTAAALPDPDRLAAYFGAVASYDPGRLAQAQDVAADGSPAEGYAAYLTEFAASAAAGGQPVPPAAAEEVDGGFRACGGSGAPDQCVTWTDLEGSAGELTDFTVDGTPVDDSLVDLTAQPPVELAGLYAVQPTWAYHSPQSGSLFVLATVTARDVPLTVGPGTYIEQDRILDTVPSRGPTRVEAGTSAPVTLAFPDAGRLTLDGQVTFGLRVGDPAAGGTEESVGFGLAAPPV